MLTDTAIRKAKPGEKSFKMADEKGLFLYVSTTGKKYFRLRYWHQKKEQVITLGEYPSMTLAEARRARDEAKAQVKSGKHLGQERKLKRQQHHQNALTTFESAARMWLSEASKHVGNERQKRMSRTLEQEVFPIIGSFPIAAVSAANVRMLLKGIVTRGAPSTAKLVQQLCGAVFRYGVLEELCPTDPTQMLRGWLKCPAVKHRRPLDKKAIPDFARALNNYSGRPTTKAALQLILLTFVRPNEMRTAHWDDFDLQNKEWRIPAPKTKKKDMLIVPLSTQAMAVLEELLRHTEGKGYLFPNVRRPNSYIGQTTLNRALEYMGYAGKFSAHGFRATASTFLNELAVRGDLIEKRLSHTERDRVRASYNHAQYMDERRSMMQRWADFLDEQTSRNAGNSLVAQGGMTAGVQVQ